MRASRSKRVFAGSAAILALISLALLARVGRRSEGRWLDARTFPMALSKQEWRERLTEEQFRILRLGRTERAFTGEYLKNKEEGRYLCAGCEQPLFSSDAKYDSGTGWPSFWAPIHMDRVSLDGNASTPERPSEVVCSNCGGHLGHVFLNGPEPTGHRYCINSLALEFEPGSLANRL